MWRQQWWLSALAQQFARGSSGAIGCSIAITKSLVFRNFPPPIVPMTRASSVTTSALSCYASSVPVAIASSWSSYIENGCASSGYTKHPYRPAGIRKTLLKMDNGGLQPSRRIRLNQPLVAVSFWEGIRPPGRHWFACDCSMWRMVSRPRRHFVEEINL